MHPDACIRRLSSKAHHPPRLRTRLALLALSALLACCERLTPTAVGPPPHDAPSATTKPESAQRGRVEILVTKCFSVREVAGPTGKRYCTPVLYTVSASSRELAEYFYFWLEDMIAPEPGRFVRLERADGSDIPLCDEPPPPPDEVRLLVRSTGRFGEPRFKVERLPSGAWATTERLLPIWTCNPPSGEVTIRLDADALWMASNSRLPEYRRVMKQTPTPADLIPAGGLTSPAVTLKVPEPEPPPPRLVPPEPGAAIIRQP